MRPFFTIRTSVIYFIVNSLVLTFERAQSAPFFSVLRIAFIHHLRRSKACLVRRHTKCDGLTLQPASPLSRKYFGLQNIFREIYFSYFIFFMQGLFSPPPHKVRRLDISLILLFPENILVYKIFFGRFIFIRIKDNGAVAPFLLSRTNVIYDIATSSFSHSKELNPQPFCSL